MAMVRLCTHHPTIPCTRSD